MLDIKTNQKQVPQEETTEEMNQELKKKIKLLLQKEEGNNLEFKECKIIIPLKEDLVNQLSEDKSSHKTVEKTVEKSSQNGSQNGSQKNSQKILELIKQNKQITIEELSNILGITDRAVKKNIAKLKQQGKLKRIGPDKGGYWEVRE